jgi:acyl-CoA reductase-like NAD-dependent aldehyde dehydrogenase
MRELTADGPPVLPSWVRGRAFLTLTSGFAEVRDATGRIVRRTPLCGADEVGEAVASARAALPDWGAWTADERQTLLVAWADALQKHAAHFAGLLGEERGKSASEVQDEVSAAIVALRATAPVATENAGCVVACAWDAKMPLADAVRLMAPVLRAGGVVIGKPCASAPGAAYALCELSARVGVPPGVVNLVQGEAAVLAAFSTHGDIEYVFPFAGETKP